MAISYSLVVASKNAAAIAFCELIYATATGLPADAILPFGISPAVLLSTPARLDEFPPVVAGGGGGVDGIELGKGDTDGSQRQAWFGHKLILAWRSSIRSFHRPLPLLIARV